MSNLRYYTVLGASTQDDIKKIEVLYKAALKKNHPDVNKSVDAIVITQKILEAWNWIKTNHVQERPRIKPSVYWHDNLDMDDFYSEFTERIHPKNYFQSVTLLVFFPLQHPVKLHVLRENDRYTFIIPKNTNRSSYDILFDFNGNRYLNDVDEVKCRLTVNLGPKK